ncbi:hypothetical protein [Salinisphaera sp.]|uniref:hypothetical protein n=1 Tax=Salinisphaera sp. TaxID=1914330 RepID=UPI002D78C801|nr:hypothetical protein [Salinisphaera sp.]HET7314193.1 hypothetical protein [Salinisphaera sp.]
MGYNSNLPFTGDHPIDGPEHNQSIGVLQRFNADRESDPKKKAQMLQSLLNKRIETFKSHEQKAAQDRINYLGNITDADLKEQGFYYYDPDDGGKYKPALLLPCGSYKTKSVCNQ